ncbi:hypothetical protein [Anaerotignum propionicum]|nr:hypothetical protein [Anaerotignum propionicum]
MIPNDTVAWLVEKMSNRYSKVVWDGKAYYPWPTKLERLNLK